MGWPRRLSSVLMLRGLLTEWLGLRPASFGAFMLAALIVGAASGLRILLTPWLVGAQFITFFPAVIVVTLLCGTAAGLGAVAFAAVAAWLLFQANGLSVREAISLLLFSGVALMDVGIMTVVLAANAALRASVARVDQLNRNLSESEGRFRDLIETAPDAMVIVNRSNRITLINAEAEHLFGYARAELLGQPIERLMPARFRAPHVHHVEAYMAQPRMRPMGEELDLRGLRKDGSEFPIEAKLSPLRSGEQTVVSTVIRDITARKLDEQRQTLLIHELNHRVKNTLATVQAISTQTLGSADGAAEFRAAFSARLAALSRSHDILTRNDWSGANVRELAEQQLRPHERPAGDRFRLEGPTVRLTPNAALALGMTLGELTTNAAKYGALSTDKGAVSLIWEPLTRDGETWLRLTWRESGGPAVHAPTRSGFGVRLIERGLVRSLGGSARLEFDPDGLSCLIEFPIAGGAA